MCAARPTDLSSNWSRAAYGRAQGTLASNRNIATLESALLFGELRSGGIRFSDAELSEELTRSYLAYLGISLLCGALALAVTLPG